MLAKESYIYQRWIGGAHGFGRPVRESLQLGPQQEMGLSANFDEPFIAGVGVQIALGTGVNFVRLLAANLHHCLRSLLHFGIYGIKFVYFKEVLEGVGRKVIFCDECIKISKNQVPPIMYPLTAVVQDEGIVLDPLDLAEKLVGVLEGSIADFFRQGLEAHRVHEILFVGLGEHF